MSNTEEREGEGKQYIITLVHGTGAKKSSTEEGGWIRQDSAMSNALRKRLGEKTTKVFPFVWTGRNSPLARHEAAEKLATELVLRINKYDSARHYIVCHSHGGDVTMRALASSNLEEKIDGVVCLATPFLVARERDLGPDPIKYLSAAAIFVGLLIMWGTQAVLPASWTELWRLVTATLSSVVTMVALLALFMKWQVYAQKLQQEFAPPTIAPGKVLIIRSSGDEASGVLVFAQFISQVTVLLFLKTQRLYERFEMTAARWAMHKKRLVAVAFGSFGSVFGFLIAYATLKGHGFSGWTTNLPLVGVYLSLLTTMEALVLIVPWLGVDGATVIFRLAVSALVWPMIFVLSLFLVLPFGWQVALASVLLDVTAEATPVTGSEGKPWTVHLIACPTIRDLGPNMSLLTHSRVYQNPRVLEVVCDWIADLAPNLCCSGRAWKG